MTSKSLFPHTQFQEISLSIQLFTILAPLLWCWCWHRGQKNKKNDTENKRQDQHLYLFHQLTNLYQYGAAGQYFILIIRILIISLLGWTWQQTILIAHQERGAIFPLYSFFTIWNFVVLTIYFSMATFLSIVQCFLPKGFHSSIYYFSYPTWILYQQQCSANILVSLGFWLFTFPALYGKVNSIHLTGITSIVQHLLNSVFIIGEFRWTRLHVEWKRIDVAMILSVVYFSSSVITYGALPSIPIDLKSHGSALTIIFLLCIHVGAHAAFCQLSSSRYTEHVKSF